MSGTDCINPMCTGRELHIIARDYSLLLRASWLALHGLGWRHYMPNGVAGLEALWIYKHQRERIRTTVDRIWSGAVDHLLASIAGGTSNIGWSDGTNHANAQFSNGLLEGNLKGAIGESPVVDVTTTAVGATFDAEKLTAIPTATDMWAVLSQSQGVRMQGYDVGGSHKSQALGYEGFGVRGQSQFAIDGIQSEGNYPNALSMEEIAVSAAGVEG